MTTPPHAPTRPPEPPEPPGSSGPPEPPLPEPPEYGSASATPAARAGNTTLSVTAIVIAAVAIIMAAAALWPGRAGHTATSAAPATVAANGQVRTFNIELGDMFVRPSSVSVPSGTAVVLHVVNRGTMDHDLQLEGGSTGTGMLSPGQSKTVNYGAFGHTEQAWCTVPGHKAAGMILTVNVTGAPPAAPAASSSATSGGTDAVINPGATPPAGWHAANPAVAPAPSGTVHRITLVAEDKEIQVAPGVTQDMWTYNAQVPGPTLRGKVGDEFVVTLVNHTNMDHSIDFHAASQPMQDMEEVAPGHSTTYTFRAMYSGAYLYHCMTAPVLEHLANGMFGAVIIDPPNLPAVSKEFLVVQSELYLGPQRQSGDYAKMVSGQPSAEVFNEYYNQYLYQPLKVTAGQQVRIWVVDAGPSNDSSFHVVGAQFTTVFNNGAYLLQPGSPGGGAAQTLNLMPGEGGFVEFKVPAAGMYEMLDHHLDRATTGAAGYIMASAQGK